MDRTTGKTASRPPKGYLKALTQLSANGHFAGEIAVHFLSLNQSIDVHLICHF
jgi:hypothetical protein